MSSQLPKGLRDAVMQRDGWVCVTCGAPATQVDHIWPESRGGTHDMSNLQAMCQKHNRAKSDHIIERSTYYDPTYFPNGLTDSK